MKQIRILVIFLLFALLFSCEKNKDNQSENNKIKFGSTTIDSISYRMVKVTTILLSTGDNKITQHGHCRSLQPNPTIYSTLTLLGAIYSPGSFTSEFSRLDPNRKYYIRAYATYENGTLYGDQLSFTTLDDPCNGKTEIIIQGQSYKVIAIGTQCWMAENINVGQRIDGDIEMTDNSILEKYCYNDNENKCIK